MAETKQHRRARDAFTAALARHQAGDPAGALAGYDQALRRDPRQSDVLNNRGIALTQLGRPDDALASFAKAIAFAAGNPARLADAHANRGIALGNLDRFAEALAAFDAALALVPAHPAALHYRPAAAAALALDRAAAQGLPLPAAPYDRALLHWRQGDPAATLAATDLAVSRDPAHAAAHNLRGLALGALGRTEQALAAYDRAIACDPASASAVSNRAELLLQLGRIDEAAAGMARALALDPGLGHAAGQLLHLRMRLSDWADHDAALAAVTAGLTGGTATPSPFALLSLVDDPALHALAATRQLERSFPAAARLPTSPDLTDTDLTGPDPNGRIRIGYFSGDFFAHATMFLMADVLAAHDRDRFEITLFSWGPNTGDPWRRRAEAAADRFIDVQDRSDQDIAALARSLGIAIAVDLKGLTGGSRTGIFAARAAPLQVNWLGYPGSVPAPFVDYLIADPHLIPPAERTHHAERIVTLPHSYQPNCRIDPAPHPIEPDRAELGLPDGAFVFCCFNQNYKITPALFGVWMRILGAVPGSVLWLWAEAPTARDNLRQAAAAHGIDPDRLVFAALVPRDRHLARLAHADLFLDTRPYGAHTSGSDALRAGVPLLTCPGRSFASRVGASLLHAAGLPDLICADLEEYAARAIALAGTPGDLAAVRARLANRAASPLFDPARFTRHLEAACTAIHQRALRGDPPADITIPA